jgi:diadenosine tetraphosphate (Ap4A) HIT family hydrolase
LGYGLNIGINDGIAAGQTVMHLHIHLIPRFDGDIANPRGGVRGVIPERRIYYPLDLLKQKKDRADAIRVNGVIDVYRTQ